MRMLPGEDVILGGSQLELAAHAIPPTVAVQAALRVWPGAQRMQTQTQQPPPTRERKVRPPRVSCEGTVLARGGGVGTA